MVRLNFEIPDDLHDQARRLAADPGQARTGPVTDELRRAVARADADEPFGGGDDGS
jgi:hypothetical protein